MPLEPSHPISVLAIILSTIATRNLPGPIIQPVSHEPESRRIEII